MKWRHVPLVLQLAFVLQLVLPICRVVLSAIGLSDSDLMHRIQLVLISFRYVESVLFAVGMLELARRLTGRGRIGAQIALAGALLGLLVSLVLPVVLAKVAFESYQAWLTRFGYAWFAAGAVILVGLAVAASSRRLAIAAIGLVVGLVAEQPPFLQEAIREALGLGIRGWVYLSSGSGLIVTVMSLLLVLVLGPPGGDGVDLEPAEPELAVRGLRRAARSLWLRVIAVGAVPLVMVIAVAGKLDSAVGTLELVALGAGFVGILSLTQFAIGALGVARARLEGMRTLPLYVAAIAALTSAGHALSQVSELYRLRYGGGFGEQSRAPWTNVAPLVAIGALCLFAGAIAGFARRRSFHDLRLEASGKGVIAGMLLLAPLAITHWVLPEMASKGGFPYGTMLMTVGCALAGTVMMARLYERAGEAISEQPSLPTARLT